MEKLRLSSIDFFFLSFLNLFHFQGEIKPSDGNEIQGAYEELYVQISAETFEKIDAAVSIIELLVTSVSVSLVILKIAISSMIHGCSDIF
jgi:hypothetical protein